MKIEYNYYENGNIRTKTYKEDDKFKIIEDKPNYIEYYENGKLRIEAWNQEEKSFSWHRENDKPAMIEYYKNGNIKNENWYFNNCLERFNDKPTVITYYEDGNLKSESWYENGYISRINKPAIIEYYKNGNIKKIEFRYLNWLHCLTQPAIQEFNKNRKLIKTEWYYYNMPIIINELTDNYMKGQFMGSEIETYFNEKKELHNLNGLAINIHFADNDPNNFNNIIQEYYINGIQYTDEFEYLLEIGNYKKKIVN